MDEGIIEKVAEMMAKIYSKNDVEYEAIYFCCLEKRESIFRNYKSEKGEFFIYVYVTLRWAAKKCRDELWRNRELHEPITVDPNNLNLDEELYKKKLAEIFLQGIIKLKEKEKIAIIAKTYLDMTQKQIAYEIFGVTDGAVAGYIDSAERKLENHFDLNGIEELYYES